MTKNKLKAFTIKGYKSICSIENFEPRPVNILIGPNGAGKSNFISFFEFLGHILNAGGKLQEYVAYLGGANDILFDGVDVTKSIDAEISIETSNGLTEYKFNLTFAKPDRLVFRDESYRFLENNKQGQAEWISCGTGHEESLLPEVNDKTVASVFNLLRRLIIYRFYNTSDTANMRLKWSSDDGRRLKQNGDNLGSFLYRMQDKEKAYYNRIVRYLRLILPFFEDFELYDEFGKVMLRWKEKGTDKIFNAGQASDGMLRTIALVSLLAQNPKDLPDVVFIDEPELGLHPAAIDTIAGLIKAASSDCQIFVATQSLNLVNNFDLDDLVVINRKGRASEYIRPESEKLKAYLNDFSTGQIWEKNIIGGRP